MNKFPIFYGIIPGRYGSKRFQVVARVVVAIRRPAALSIAEPATTAYHPVRACAVTHRIIHRTTGIGSMPIPHPFPYIAVHVE